jgi:predicted DNA-binding transcriptional regulator YafY
MIRGNELVNALAKVKSFIHADRAKDIELKANRVHIDLNPWMGNRNIQTYLGIIKTALRESRLLSFEYADRYGNKTARTAEPYQLVLKGNHWYFWGYCHKRDDFRLFKLSRLSNLLIQEMSFAPQDYKKLQLDFLADILETMPAKIKIRIRKSIMKRVIDYCINERFSPDGDEHYIVDFLFIENEYSYNILLGFGDKCERLEPNHIRPEMKRRIHDIATLYVIFVVNINSRS